MGLSTVIQDLEAEGASRVTTAAFLSSRSVRRTTRSKLLRSLFGVSGAGDHDDEVSYGSTTAFGKKLASDGAGDEDEEGSGVAVACPDVGASVSEVSSTVVACGGTVVYVADPVDLGRGEGLFDTLGPAVERVLAARAQEEGGHSPSTLIVVIDGASGMTGRSQFEAAASKMLQSIIQPSASKRASSLDDVFDRIEYMSSTDADVDVHLCSAGGRVGHTSSPNARDPSDIAGGIGDVVASGLVENLGPVMEMAYKVPVKQACPRLTNPVDLAAARLLGPAARKALDECHAVVAQATAGGTLVSDFGDLCDAAVKRAVSTFDEAAGSLRKLSPVARRIRADLKENLYAELSDEYDAQVAALKSSSFDVYRARLSKLRISPLLASDMKAAGDETLAEFVSAAKKLRAKHAPGSLWESHADHANDVKGKMVSFGADRIKAAKASGQYKEAPRKGVTLGFHWLLPKPFGNDYRQEPWETRTADDLVYSPKDGITDVSSADIRTGDWRKSVVPAPSGTEMLYLK